ncbi:MAG: DUF3858 domain-containing protein [Acidobacteria bacterium]|nr:MAG: DUF3858 domain-containing protein [Acidobacteriota bacterium]
MRASIRRLVAGIAALAAAGALPPARAASAEWEALLLHGQLQPLRERWERSANDLGAALGLAAALDARGDTDGALAVLSAAVESSSAAGLPAAGALARALLLSDRASDGGASLLPLLDRIAGGELPVPDPEAASLARLARVDIVRRAGRGAGALASATRAAGLVTRWRWLGPFGRFDRLDMARTFPPERGSIAIPAPAPAMGPMGLEAAYGDGIAVLPDDLRGPGVAYAVAAFDLDRASDARVRVSCDTSFELWIDGVRAAGADRWRERPPSAQAFLARLRAGRHRLVVKVPSGERRPTVSVALERADGAGPLPGVAEAIPDAGSEPAGLEGEPAPSPSPLDEEAAAVDPAADPETAVAALSWLTVRGRVREVGALLERFAAAWPDAGLPSLWLGRHLAEAETGASPLSDLAQARSRLEKALEADPRLMRAHLLLGELDLLDGRLDAAYGHAEAALALVPDQPDALELAHRVALERGFLPEADRAISRALAEAPGRPDLLEAALKLARRRNAPGRAFELSEESARRGASPVSHARLLAARGDLAGALALLDARLAAWPADAGARLAKALLLADAGQLEDALGTVREITVRRPRNVTARLAEAGLLDRLGLHRQAESVLERVLETAPGRLDIRELLSMRGRREPLTKFLVDPREVLDRARSRGPGVDSALLADIAVVEIDARGGQTELYQGIHAVYTRAGVDKEGELEIPPGAQVEWIRIHKKDGRFVDVRTGRRRPVSLPGLEPGDAVEYVWWRYIPPLFGLPGVLDNRSLFVFQGPQRSFALSRYVVAHDERLDVHTCGDERGLEVQRSHEDGLAIVSWTARGMPRLHLEPHIADRVEAVPHIRLSMGADWALLGDGIRNALVGLLRIDPPLDAMLEEIRRRAAGGDEEALARALHAVVLERLRPGASSFAPSLPASMAASAGEGNRLLVAAALARALGLRARIVLARPIEQKGRFLDCPGPDLFGYPLLELTAGGQRVFLDYNGADFPFGELEPRLAGSDALFVPLGEGEAAVESLPPLEPRLLRRDEADLRLDPDGSVSGRVLVEFRGSLAAHTRRLLEGVPRNRLPEVYQALAGDLFPGAAVHDADTDGTGDPERPLRLTLEIGGGRWPRRTPSGFALPVVLEPMNLLGEYASLERRRQPLLYDATALQREEIRLTVPPGLQIRDVPAPVELSGRFGSYRLEVSAEGRVVSVVREVLLPPQRVEPEDYPEFRRLAMEVAQAERAEIVLQAPSPSLAPRGDGEERQGAAGERRLPDPLDSGAP